jgi:hypothetical protein
VNEEEDRCWNGYRDAEHGENGRAGDAEEHLKSCEDENARGHVADDGPCFGSGGHTRDEASSWTPVALSLLERYLSFEHAIASVSGV